MANRAYVHVDIYMIFQRFYFFTMSTLYENAYSENNK